MAFVPVNHMVLVHWVGRTRQRFLLVGCQPDWELTRSEEFPTMAQALLVAAEVYSVRLASWEIYGPPAGQKLFTDHDPRWLRRRHRNVRHDFIWLRWRVRPSNRFVQAVAKLRQSGPAT